MTLRLVSDNQQPGVLYCRHGAGCRNPATILVSFLGKHYLPSCDECARSTYDRHPEDTRFAPLAEYVDEFAIARETALVTPEQIIEPTGNGLTEADNMIRRHTHNDHRVYCRWYWCEQGWKLTPASIYLEDNKTGYGYPSCSSCARRYAESENGAGRQAKTWPLDENQKNRIWALVAEPFRRGEPWTLEADSVPAPAASASNGFTAEERAARAGRQDRSKTSLGAWLAIGLLTLGSFILGGIMVGHGAAGGLLFIALPIVCWLGAGLAWIIKFGVEEERKAKQKIQGQLSGPGVDVGRLAMGALPWAAYAIEHHHKIEARRHQEQQHELRRIADSIDPPPSYIRREGHYNYGRIPRW
jgi:hypothetical protein